MYILHELGTHPGQQRRALAVQQKMTMFTLRLRNPEKPGVLSKSVECSLFPAFSFGVRGRVA